MVASITEHFQQMELVKSSVKQPSSICLSLPHSAASSSSGHGSFGSHAPPTQNMEIGTRSNSQCQAAGGVAAPSYQFRSTPTSASPHRSRRVSSQPLPTRVRTQIVWRPGASRMWRVKCSRKIAPIPGTNSVKSAWSTGAIHWKPLATAGKFASEVQSPSSACEGVAQSPFSDSEMITVRRPKSQPCMVLDHNLYGKRVRDEGDAATHSDLYYGRMKKSCSYSGLDSIENEFVALKLTAHSDRGAESSKFNRPPTWGADLDIDAIEGDTTLTKST